MLFRRWFWLPSFIYQLVTRGPSVDECVFNFSRCRQLSGENLGQSVFALCFTTCRVHQVNFTVNDKTFQVRRFAQATSTQVSSPP